MSCMGNEKKCRMWDYTGSQQVNMQIRQSTTKWKVSKWQALFSEKLEWFNQNWTVKWLITSHTVKIGTATGLIMIQVQLPSHAAVWEWVAARDLEVEQWQNQKHSDLKVAKGCLKKKKNMKIKKGRSSSPSAVYCKATNYAIISLFTTDHNKKKMICKE